MKMFEQETKRGCGEEKIESQHMLFNIRGRRSLSRRNDLKINDVSKYVQNDM